MDLDFSDEQRLLRDTVRDLCAKHVPLDVVRALENDPERYPEDFWKQAGQLGLHGMRLPEEHGGTDMTLLDAAVVYAEFGRALVPSPHFVGTVLAGQVIAAAGSAEQRERWLPRIASGAGVFTVAWLEPDRGGGRRECGPRLYLWAAIASAAPNDMSPMPAARSGFWSWRATRPRPTSSSCWWIRLPTA
ncbi:acyl-CoA dehydrogenase family protein [Catenulispora yoronensis]